MRVLLLADRDTSFQGRYLAAMSGALAARGVAVETVVAPVPRLYSGALDEARERGCDHVHAVFMQDAPALHDAIACSPPGVLTWSFSTFGLGLPARQRDHRDALRALAMRSEVSRILVHSIHPRVAAQRWHELELPTTDTVYWAPEPIYDMPTAFEISRDEARSMLGLPADRSIALCFGAFSPRKGGDLLASAASRAHGSEVLFVFVGTGASQITSAGANIRVDDAYVDYRTAAQYFRACDFVVLPYRRSYEDETSGVLVQAALAARPVIVPDISPFRETVTELELGITFECENEGSLAGAVAAMARTSAGFGGFARYLAGAQSWAQLAVQVDDRS